MNGTGTRGCIPNINWKPPSEKQLAVYALTREVECAEYILKLANERLAKAKIELMVEKSLK